MTAHSAWPRVGEVDPLCLLGHESRPDVFCSENGRTSDPCTRRWGGHRVHVASDWTDDRLYETTEVRDVWLTLSGDDALAPLLDAITATAGDRAPAVRAAVLDALGVGR